MFPELIPTDDNTLTLFGRALKNLDIECIYTKTPQAKSQVKSVNQTLQDYI